MKKIILCLAAAFVISTSAEACPYQKMAEVDSKLYSGENKINTETFAMVSNLRMQGEKKLQIGELDNAELIFDRALSLLDNK